MYGPRDVLRFLISRVLVGRMGPIKQRYRAWRESGGMIPTVPLEAISERFAHGVFGTTVNAEATILGTISHEGVLGGTSDYEAWVLAVLAKDMLAAFEFGTCTGRTAYLFARNSPTNAVVETLTLLPESKSLYSVGAADDVLSTRFAIAESRFSEFVYSGTPYESKILQHYGDSKDFSVEGRTRSYDLVFVDGSHAYSYVVSDSKKALAMARPGGLILWHDYGHSLLLPGVSKALNQLARALPLVRLSGTTLVAYRVPKTEHRPELPDSWKSST